MSLGKYLSTWCAIPAKEDACFALFQGFVDALGNEVVTTAKKQLSLIAQQLGFCALFGRFALPVMAWM